MAYNKLYKHWRRSFFNQFGGPFNDPEPKAKQAVAQLHHLVQDQRGTADFGSAASDRVGAYELWAHHYDKIVEKRQIDLRRQAKVARQELVSGPLISAPYLAADIIGTSAAHNLKHNPKAAASNSMAAQIGTTLAAISSLGLTTSTFIGDELHTRRLKKLNALPSELLAQRLKTLDEVQVLAGGKNPH
jgi:hypothetical protein